MRSVSRNLATLLVRTARNWPHLPAVAVGARLLHDYAALCRRAAGLAAGLQAAGVQRGDRVALVARNTPQYIETLFACWWAGAIAVPVNAKLHVKELAFVLADSGTRVALVDEAWQAALADADAPERVIALGAAEYERLVTHTPLGDPLAVSADDPAWLFYTSGTTGRPKGVEITHGNLLAMAQCFLADVEAIAPGDALLHPAPLSHGSGLYLIPHVARGAVSVIPASGGFDPAEIADLVKAWKRCLFFAAPTMVKRLVDAPELAQLRLEHLKCIVYGGGPMYVEDCKAAFAALGARLAQIYGQGESPMTITAMDRALLADAMTRGDDARIASVGCAQTGIEVRIAGPDHLPLPAGEVGEVLVRGPTVMHGYWRNAEATAQALGGGWLHTGDLGTLDDNGFLTLKDRSKDLIISGGSNIYPREVEEALLKHPDVAEVAVIGRVHPDWGEEVVACVVARSTMRDEAALESALDALCLQHIARFKRPKAYVFLQELPKNNTGKVLKTELRAQLKKK
ncbi:MAG: AMP-binding protein [Casimicrobiaceae bacterium]